LTPTATSTAEHTATSVPSPPAPACAGDCDGDRQVSISELVRAVNYALDDRFPEDCVAVDGNRDHRVTVDELVRAVTRALNGCGSEQPERSGAGVPSRRLIAQVARPV
jgi:hypothetical protein